MATKRTKAGQAKHDRAVLNSAKWHESHGFRVKADLPGYKKPKSIGGHVPDIIATKGKRTEKIIEVETRQGAKKDLPQQKAFKRYADRQSGRSFKKKVV